MKAISLISGGIDSPVATYLVKKRGINIIGLHFGSILDITDIAKRLGIKVVQDDMSEFYKKIPKNEKFTCILCKRYMYRKAEALAKKEGAGLLITGENLGQVASQTIENMYVIDKAVNLTVLRPLLCYDKNDIIKIAKKIGTFGLSIKTRAKCPYVPYNPATKSTLKKIIEIENAYKIRN